MASSSSSIPGYVARYGDALRRLTRGEQGMGALGTVAAARIYDPSLSPNTAGLAQEAARGIATGLGAPSGGALPRQMGGADVRGALETPEQPAAAKKKGKSFWDVTKELSDSDKEKVTKQFEDKGVDVPAVYQQLVDSGQVDPGMVKRGADGKIDRRDMGLFLLEFGLRTMQAASQPGSTDLGSIAGGALGTIEARRGRGVEERRYQESRSDRAEDRSDRRAEREERRGEAAADRAHREAMTDKEIAAAAKRQGAENLSRERIARMTRGKDKETYVDQEDGTVYWLEGGEPVMVKGKDGKKKPLKGKIEADRNQVTERDILKAVTDKEAELDENLMSRVTISGESTPVRWRDATTEQREAYLDAYAETLRKRAGNRTPSGPGSNPFDAFD